MTKPFSLLLALLLCPASSTPAWAAAIRSSAPAASAPATLPAGALRLPVAGPELSLGTDLDPAKVEGRGVVVEHPLRTPDDLVTTLFMAQNLREQGAEVTVLNTYEGFARQDKIFAPGKTVAAAAMLRAVNLLAARHLGVNVHYGDQIADGLFRGERIENVNAFPALARTMFVELALKLLPGASLEDPDLGPRLAKAFAGRSLIIVAPDDGAFPMALEAAQVLGRWLQKRWGVSLDVRAAHFDKVRSSAHTVEIAPELKAGGGKALALPEGHSLADAAAFVVDDAKKRMAPARFFASDSLALPDGMAGSTVGLGPLVGWVAQTENP